VVESSALLKRRTPKGYRGFESLPHRARTWSMTPKERRAYAVVDDLPNKIARLGASIHNAVIDLIRRKTHPTVSSPELNEILQRAGKRTDISDHLPTLFQESLSIQPRVIVELGVRDGESTFVFQRVAKCCGARGVSVDIEPFTDRESDERWKFVQSDDIAFAKRFPAWCRENGFPDGIDILFIDTTHFYEHTVREIKHWFPLFAPPAKVFFHDTNLRRIYFRKDGSMGVAWTNRGVTEALENYLGKRFDEKRDFTDSVNGWSIKHFANCSGLTILSREMR
jgi:cephalosporin hydroxylase